MKKIGIISFVMALNAFGQIHIGNGTGSYSGNLWIRESGFPNEYEDCHPIWWWIQRCNRAGLPECYMIKIKSVGYSPNALVCTAIPGD